MKTDCVICRIISGASPARIVYRCEHAIAFLPLELNSKGHTVLAPVEHCADIFDINNTQLSSLMRTARFLATHIRRQLTADGINILHASGTAAQQSVLHFHIHLLPRFEGDNLDAWPSLPQWTGDLDELLTTIKVDKEST